MIVFILFFISIDFIFLMYTSTNISSQTRNKIFRKQNKTIPTIKKPNIINHSSALKNLTSDFLFLMKNNLNNQEDILNNHSQKIFNHIQSINIPSKYIKKTNHRHQCLNSIVNIKMLKGMCFYNVQWNDLDLDDLKIETMETIKNVSYQLKHISSTRKKLFFCFKKDEPNKHIENILKKNILNCKNIFYTKMKCTKTKRKQKKINHYHWFENIGEWFLNLFYKIDIENRWNRIFVNTQLFFNKIFKFFEKQIFNVCGWMELFISDWSGIMIFLCFMKKCARTNKLFMI